MLVVDLVVHWITDLSVILRKGDLRRCLLLSSIYMWVWCIWYVSKMTYCHGLLVRCGETRSHVSLRGLYRRCEMSFSTLSSILRYSDWVVESFELWNWQFDENWIVRVTCQHPTLWSRRGSETRKSSDLLDAICQPVSCRCAETLLAEGIVSLEEFCVYCLVECLYRPIPVSRSNTRTSIFPAIEVLSLATRVASV